MAQLFHIKSSNEQMLTLFVYYLKLLRISSLILHPFKNKNLHLTILKFEIR